MQQPLSPTPPRRRGSSACAVVAAGCAIGCGVLFMLVAGSVAGAGWWALSTPEQVATEPLAGDGTTAIFRLRLDLDSDPGLEAFLESLVAAADAADRARLAESLPESLRWLATLKRPTKGQGRQLLWLFPRELTATLEPPSEGSDPGLLVALNLRAFVRPLHFLLRAAASDDPNLRSRRVGRHTVYSADADSAFVFRDGTILVTSPAGLADLGLRRLDDSGGRGEAGRALAAMDQGWEAGMVALNRKGLFRRMADTGDWDAEVRPLVDLLAEHGTRVRGFFDFRGAGSVRTWLEISTDDGDAAEAVAEELARLLEAEVPQLREAGLEVLTDTEVDGREVEAFLDLENVDDLVRQMTREQAP